MPIRTRWPSTDARIDSTAQTDETTLGNRVWLILGATALVLVVTSALITGYVATIGEPGLEPPPGVIYGAVGIGLSAALALLWRRFDEPERLAAFPLQRPSRAELGWTAVCVPLGIGAFLVGEWVAGLFGFELTPFYTYDLGDPATLAGVAFGVVLVAPLVEELLFRGALVGALLGRGWSLLTASAGSIVVFAGYHVFALGVAGVAAIAAWSVFPTVLRLRFDNLTGAWLLHLCNNIFAYVIVTAVLV
ncbi:CPBP family intramembrane glutamic endopeptidase [Halopiger xanaduensis]|uniref:Abortive infection protein n=1 Tax=Halopiger xanaduensis (strain DSM 18323 / JCM 14033 / SH-6) TaxID=797210 RepID=F8D371_HALXS|nr:type II CAAX endopeptidase family protein [Halopiger xanaduensis]AEH38503.1 Abortive infection protein [Halopiger xanaduensis SH-6]